jgi:hypothetical protein
MLQTVQWFYQERKTGLKFTSNSSIISHVRCDASNDRDLQDSLCIGGALILMAGASVSYHANKLRHVGSAGSSENEYMELERATRCIMWLRNLLTSMQMFRVTKLSMANVKTTVNGNLNYGRETRLHNRTPTYLNRTTGRLLLWLTVFEGNYYGGKWAILDEYGSSTIQIIATDVSV